MNFEQSILHYFGDVEDPRATEKVTHPLVNIVSIAILGTICAADDWVAIEMYGNAKMEWLSTFLDMSNGVPSHDTFGRVFRWLDETMFEARFAEWTAHLCAASDGQVVALDGKKLRRSHDRRHGRAGIWIVSAWTSENRLVLGQRKVAEKSNEITAIPHLLRQLDLTNCIVTVDALNTQTSLAQQITEAQADYVMAVKGNQGTLLEDLALLFEGFDDDYYQSTPHDTARTTSHGHGREEYRQVWVVHQPEHRQYLRQGHKWAKLHSLVKLVTVRYVTATDKLQTTTRYFISSWHAAADEFLRVIREHWQIENGLHWVLDVAFREDDSRIRKDHAAANMARLRHIAVNLLKQESTLKVGISNKRKRAGWDNAYLEKVVCP